MLKKQTKEVPLINREISWLDFNMRVLEEAKNSGIPLFERLRFLSISAENLDEFYMVRIAGLKAQIFANVKSLSDDGLDARDQLTLIEDKLLLLIKEQQLCWKALKKELLAHEINVIDVLTEHFLSEESYLWLKSYFISDIFPTLTPIAVDPAHPFPFIPNLGFSLVLRLFNTIENKYHTALVPIPSGTNRFIQLQQEEPEKEILIPVEEVILKFIHILFPKHDIHCYGVFRVIRDSEVEIDEEAEDLVRTFETALKRRRRGHIISLILEAKMPRILKEFLEQKTGVSAQDIMADEEFIGLKDCKEIIDEQKKEFLFPPFNPRFPERIKDFNGDCFAAITHKDILVHHPYESFDVVVRFLNQAALDPHVVAIKQTLYRTSDDSPIVLALIEAAERGKSVTAMVELKARFDEEKNIKWARDLERAGVHIVYGFVDLKIHGKLSLVIRREAGKLKSYAHFGTGNYHPITAKLYTDLSLFTCEPIICRDVAFIFNFMTGYAVPEKLRKLVISPFQLRSTLLKLIDREIKYAQEGREAEIWAKLNALVDKEIIEKLYEASQAGVKITLVIRGICCLIPGLKGISDHITVKSLVGRFLEHGRIYCFGNGHALPDEGASVYIGSADWMPRNLDRRIEIMVPIEIETVKKQILDQIMVANIKDTASSYYMLPDGTYHKTAPAKGEDFSAHTYFIENPSLSGRGSSLEKTSHPPKLTLK